MKLTGELLKNERLNKNLSVQDVAQALKLSSKIVNLIEAGDSASLPAKTFVRGFVKSYAQLLKLDADSVLRQFQEEMGSTIPLPKTPPPTGSSSRADSFKTSKPTPKQTAQNYTAGQPKLHGAEIEKDYSKHTKALLSGAVILLVVALGANHLLTRSKDAAPASSEPDISSTSSAEDTAAVVTANLSSADPLAAGQPANAVETNQMASADPATNESIAQKVTTIDSLSEVPEVGFVKSKEKSVELIIEGKKDGEIYYTKSASQPFKLLKISSNQVHVLRSKAGLYVKSKDASSFKITVNGDELILPKANPKALESAELKLSF